MANGASQQSTASSLSSQPASQASIVHLVISDSGLEFVKTFLGINEEDFYRLLVNYLNDKFSDVVGDRPVRDVGTRYC